jgi:broad specificity phosphatase PhoE
LYLQDVFSEGDFFISSDSKRARDSFEMLGVLTYDVSNLFVEAQLPYGFLKKLKMPLFLWAVFLRTIWCLGYTKNCESFREFKKRVKNAYIYLHEKSRRYDHVVIMAHGFVNVNLGRELLKDNWMKVEFKNQNKYFSYKKFSKG